MFLHAIWWQELDTDFRRVALVLSAPDLGKRVEGVEYGLVGRYVGPAIGDVAEGDPPITSDQEHRLFHSVVCQSTGNIGQG